MAEKVNDIDREIAQRLRAFREYRGVDRYSIAKVLGFSLQQIAKYERGENRLSCGNLCKIADYYCVPAETFLREEEFKKERLKVTRKN